jgi:hypothetical protein
MHGARQVGDQCEGHQCTEKSIALAGLLSELRVMCVNTYTDNLPADGRQYAWTFENAHKNKRLIDVIGMPCDSTCYLDYGANLRNDHVLMWAVFKDVTGVGKMGTRRPAGRRRRAPKGWRPLDDGAAGLFRSMVSGACKGETRGLGAIGDSIALAASSVPHVVQQSRPWDFGPDQRLQEARAALREAGTAEEKWRLGRDYARALRANRDSRARRKRDHEAFWGQREDRCFTAPQSLIHRGQTLDEDTAGQAISEYFGTLYNPTGLTEQQYDEWYGQACDQLIRD